MDTTTTPQTATPVYVAMQHSELNTTVLRITPKDGGLELVEYVGHLATMERTGSDPEVVELVQQARTMATVTGSASATHRVEGAGGVLQAEATWYRNVYAAPRRALGLHRAPVASSPEQRELAQRMHAEHRQEWAKGQRRVVSELTGYLPVQHRELDHRDCHCGSGVTTYSVGTVTGLTWWADNSREAAVTLDDGRVVTVQLAPPSGDACY